jgi:hypothetical protein
MTSLDYLKQTGTVIVSDSGDFEGVYSACFSSSRLTADSTGIGVYKPQVRPLP